MQQEKRRPRFGLSTSMLQGCKNGWEALLPFEPELIEFYNYPSSEIGRISKFCEQHSITPALHVPTPYNGTSPLTRFSPTGPDPRDVEVALRLTLDTIRCAARLGAQHVVVHFPTPYPPHMPIPPTSISTFLDPVATAAATLDVLVLIENLTNHPYFCSPRSYSDVLSAYPNLGFCLDLGHAHLLAPAFECSDFLDLLAPRTHSIHLYNTTKERYQQWGHEPIHPSQEKADGWIEAQSVVRDLRDMPALGSIVLECNKIDDLNLARAIDGWQWFRSQMDSARPA